MSALEGGDRGRFTDTYRAARTGSVAFDRSRRVRLRVSGKAPAQMLGGVVTGRIPPSMEAGVPSGTRSYSALLNPKGKMLSDLYLYRIPGEEEAFLLDLPEAGAEAVRAHLLKVLPPRLARFEDVTTQVRLLTLAGPTSAERVATLVGVPAAELDSLEVDQVAVGQNEGRDILVARTGDLGEHGFDVLVPADAWTVVVGALEAAGVGWAETDVLNTLRVEAGTPAFGVDMDESTIPIEAGIGERAFDHTKGCYTGQEVIVRIRHRGHVNRHLRTLELSAPGADPGASLFAGDPDKPVGSLTSVVESPDRGPIALGYVRREVNPGERVHVGGPDGPPATVR